MAGRPRTATTGYRLPTEGDHPVVWTLVPGAIGFAWGFLLAVGDRRGLGLEPRWGLVLGSVGAVVALVVAAVGVRRAPRACRLRVGPDGMAFTVGGAERWSIRWEDVMAAGIVDGGYRNEGRGTFLRLELADGTAPTDASLHAYDGAWWFRLLGTDVPARLHHDLGRRIPGRVRRARTVEDLPPELNRW